MAGSVIVGEQPIRIAFSQAGADQKQMQVRALVGSAKEFKSPV